MQQVSRAREHQHVEWKESWRDEYQKWICGFANADGRILEIGRDDRGRIVGVEDAVRLLVDIPNKVRDILGIMVDVNLFEENGKEFVQIGVEAYPNPISGVHHPESHRGSHRGSYRGSRAARAGA